jgi:protein TonB
MMIRTAGGPGPVSPLDFNERRQPLPKGAWIAIGAVAAAHLAVGVALYYQRFEIVTPPVVDEPPITGIFVDLPKPKPPEPVKVTEVPPPPNAPVHQAPLSNVPTEVIHAVPSDTPVDTTSLTLTRLVPNPVPDARPTPEPPQPAPAVIRNPTWERQPNAGQMMRAYPQRAIADRMPGTASMSCAVRASGAVSDCIVSSETPSGYGFGRAAQELSRYFRINPRTVDGAAVDARVNITLRFTLPEN